jgi:hypothetical protein
LAKKTVFVQALNNITGKALAILSEIEGKNLENTRLKKIY